MAEGAILEPSRHYGHALLNRTADAVAERKPRFNRIKRHSGSKTAIIIQIENIDKFTDRSRELSVLTSEVTYLF
jgi:hypothetical protein